MDRIGCSSGWPALEVGALAATANAAITQSQPRERLGPGRRQASQAIYDRCKDSLECEVRAELAAMEKAGRGPGT